jgi:hypothetical protein
VETGWAMFFLAFLPRFLVILNDDLEKDELGAHSHQPMYTKKTGTKQNYKNLLRNPINPIHFIQRWHQICLR